MSVVDTSAIVAALALEDDRLLRRIATEAELHAPHLVDLEVLDALRKLVARREVSEDRAAYIREDFAALRIERSPHEPFAERVWELRANLSSYDAVFVALAETLDLPLVTYDMRLAGAPGHGATVEAFGPR